MRLLLILLILIPYPAWSAEPVEPDPLELVAQLLKDGYTDRAKELLQKVDINNQYFDFIRYYTLSGVMHHERSYPDVSNLFLEKAIELGQDNQSIYLYMAKNYWELENYPEVIRMIDLSGEAGENSKQIYMMKAEAYKKSEDYQSAWKALDEGIKRFPDFAKFYMQKFYYMVELGFYEASLEHAGAYLQHSEYTARDYLVVAYAQRSSGQFKKAAALLETAVLRHPGDEKLIELLGQVYIDQEQYLTASTIFDRASIIYPKFAHKAAVLYLKAKHPVRSLQLNRRILDQKEKFRQRLNIDIQLEDYESLVTKTEALKRYGLLKDDSILYALGYAYYRNGEYDKSVSILKKIKDSELFARASNLFTVIEKCKNEPVECV